MQLGLVLFQVIPAGQRFKSPALVWDDKPGLLSLCRFKFISLVIKQIC